jgi:hypothetical protein
MSDHASDLLRNDESAVVIFTRGSKFKFEKSGKGYSGNWLINPNHKFDRVIIYYRPEDRRSGAELYTGDFKDIGAPIEPRKRCRKG